MANERRLIDVSKLVKPPYAEDDNITGMGMSYDEQCGYNDGIDAMWSIMMHYVPTVDAVEVVRCRDCRFAHRVDGPREKYSCVNASYFTPWFNGDDFCSRGERRCE